MIELLVVISIIALLVSILLPALGAARQSAVQVQCMSQIRSFGQALHMYQTDRQGWFPFGLDLRDANDATRRMRHVLGSYLNYEPNTTAFENYMPATCPAAMDAVALNGTSAGKYMTNAMLTPFMQGDGTTLAPYHNSLRPNQQIKDVHVDNPSEITMVYEHKRPTWYWMDDYFRKYSPGLSMWLHFSTEENVEWFGLTGGTGNGAANIAFVDGHAGGFRKEDFVGGTADWSVSAWESWRVAKP